MVYGGQTSVTFEGLPKGRPISLYPEDVDYLREQDPGDPEHRPGVVQLSPGLGQRQGDQPERPRHDRRVRRDAHPGPPARRPVPQRRRRSPRAARSPSSAGRSAADLFGAGGPHRPDSSSSTASPSPSSASWRRSSRIRCTTVRTPTRSICRSTPICQIGQPPPHQPDPHPAPPGLAVHADRGPGPHAPRPEVPLRPGRPLRHELLEHHRGRQGGQAIFKGIEIFLGIMGALTLLIGAVGVTNLMYAAAKERTGAVDSVCSRLFNLSNT
ncbi:MAG: hypothetical protein M0C28_33155 [Candidatus Moduliflexus flocculans]|nr:hypothetical protein [Candidatus Moduliflexus flocculans]